MTVCKICRIVIEKYIRLPKTISGKKIIVEGETCKYYKTMVKANYDSLLTESYKSSKKIYQAMFVNEKGNCSMLDTIDKEFDIKYIPLNEDYSWLLNFMFNTKFQSSFSNSHCTKWIQAY